MAPQDTFIEEEDDTCPLCIEEFDLSDRNFKPCPCGYKVCQFCFNNIKENINGLCPGCRRPYDEKTIQWKVVTPEEMAEFRSNIQKNQKKRATEQRQKEVQKREAEKENRKNLVGVRVVQKNLVYVTGLTPTMKEEELPKTLRKPEYFGQYGNIQKISISNRKNPDGQNPSLGVYVTFERKDDAQKCIQAVNGSLNGDRVLKAQLGTTKYCSAWLRHEQCTNRQCMFLHEQGDEEDSYTRQDLSSMNSINSQRPFANPGTSSRSASRQQMQSQASQAAAQPMVRSSSKDGSENGDGSALPSSANWARNPQVQARSRRSSQATSGTTASPAISTSLPATAEFDPAESAIQEEELASPTSSSQEAPSTTATPSVQASASIHKDFRDIMLETLLKALGQCPFPVIPSRGNDFYDAFPPLFDPRGGEKRRAMRDEEETRETRGGEEQEEQLEIREPPEDEPESSGSLALGGEPEHRDPRRGVAQRPIERTTTDALFGSVGGSFMPGSNINSIGSRTLTPQQAAYSRSQGGFDHLPPGISSQSNLFQGQGQGHSRQSSRFSFANENAGSSTSVKLAANPRIMAQQSSMMPPSLHSQQTNPYFSSSMPGPPPGLKSTGTPPSMFGQGHSYGGASGFGAGASKDNSQLLQEIIRGRGGAGNQAHDAGKREYMFPSSFSNQYPTSTSSTPAPAPGFSASLYGTLPGAFQDIGSKQKKKGKKHRHANTSSSGGSALVDLADPSILRMQHQQSNAGVGQGLFGGQGQDDGLPSMDEATSSVDALVSDEPDQPTLREPPAFEAPFLGAGHSHSHPPAGALLPALSGAGVGRRVPLPAVPLDLGSTTSASPLGPKSVVFGAEARKNIKVLAMESGLAKDIASQSKPSKPNSVLQDEDFPALDTAKPAASQVPSAAAAPALPKVLHAKTPGTASRKASVVVPAVTPAPSADVKKLAKKTAPAALNIAAAVGAAKTKETSSAGDKSADLASFPALPTPTTASVASPITRNPPKTLRVVPTPKTELPPALSSQSSNVADLRSSVRSVMSSNRPGTPTSEVISDNASVISASVSASRTSSPPPSGIGSAVTRTTTKSQQRKQRKQTTKKEPSTLASQPVIEQEAEVGPILGRKKKQKKEKERFDSSGTTPVGSRPVTPTIPTLPTVRDEIENVEDVSVEGQPAEKANQKGKSAKSATPSPPPAEPIVEDKAEEAPSVPKKTGSDKAHATVSTVLQELVECGEVPDSEKIALLKPFIGLSHRYENRDTVIARDVTMPTKTLFTDAEHAALLDGKVLRKVIDGVRVMITPNGDCIRNLTEEEEDRFLQLQAQVSVAATTPSAYVHPRHESIGGFGLVKGRAVPNGPPTYFPQPNNTYSLQNPVHKIQRDEAIYWINQYVLPRLNMATHNLNTYWKSVLADGAASRTSGSASIAPWIYNNNSGDNPVLEAALPQFESMATGVPEETAGSSAVTDNLPLMSLEEAEMALIAAKKEADKMEKSLNQVIKKNRRILLASAH